MPEQQPRLVTQADGTVQVFYRGWRFAFSETGERPTVSKEDAPVGARPAGSKVKTRGPRMRYGGWVVVFTNGGKEPRVIQARPPDFPSVVQRLYRAMLRR